MRSPGLCGLCCPGRLTQIQNYYELAFPEISPVHFSAPVMWISVKISDMSITFSFDFDALEKSESEIRERFIQNPSNIN